jgi:uncharacterized LabA/DUF88 family protein
MKKIILILISALMVVSACDKAEFEKAYPDPSKISVTTVEKQFAGYLTANLNYVLPDYWNYFVILRITSNRWTQSVGWVNANAQYVPGGNAVDSRWQNFYNLMSQYRELQNIYEKLPAEEKTDKRIYMIAATIYLYDHAQRVVDLHGDIPWSEAGMMSANGGDYQKSKPKYDSAESIYTQMLDDLKGFADELNTITIKPGIKTGFDTQDYINKGSLDKWKRYNNSLRLRMLTRVSGASAFQSRATSEISSILGNPTSYPVLTENSQNIQINVHDQNTPIHSRNFRTGLEDWGGNYAGKVMIDHMKANQDPRLRVVFQPGRVDNQFITEYHGIDPMANSTAQEAFITTGQVATYNWSTLSRNQFFPGILINTAEVNFLAAEAYLNANQDAPAKAAYEAGISNSVKFYYQLRSISNNNESPAVTAATDAEIADYIAKSQISWSNAATKEAKLNLIATQKWIHFNVVQPHDNWAELRRLKLPQLSFWVDPSDAQKQPPTRWQYPDSERTYNDENYSAVSAKDNLSTKLFWDVK